MVAFYCCVLSSILFPLLEGGGGKLLQNREEIEIMHSIVKLLGSYFLFKNENDIFETVPVLSFENPVYKTMTVVISGLEYGSSSMDDKHPFQFWG